MKKQIYITSCLILLLVLAANAQRHSSKIVKYNLHSKNKSVKALKTKYKSQSYCITFADTIKIDDASWLQVKFNNYKLTDGSLITITSLKDGHTQHLNNVSLNQWQNSSAIFNGHAIKIELFSKNEVTSDFFEINEIVVSDMVNDFDSGETEITTSLATACIDIGRTSETDARVGRFWVFSYSRSAGTIYLISNGTILTAGHVAAHISSDRVVEFNFPDSECDGTCVAAAPEHQYVVDESTLIYMNAGLGEDWAVFQCFPNTETGLLPHERQSSFLRITNNIPAVDEVTRVTGCGEDNYLPGCTGDFNSDNRTLQTVTGPFKSNNGNYVRSEIIVTAGNSGSPLIWETNGFSIGIITHGNCNNPPNCSATSFNNSDLASAIQNFYSNNTIYVDKIRFYPSYEDGSIFSPYDKLTEAISASASGGIIQMTPGTYNEGELLIDKAITILPPPCGSVAINP